METVRKITNELAISGQLNLNELQQLTGEGYRSVMNLRSPSEIGFLNSEQKKVEDLNLRYANIPIQIKSLSIDNVLSVVQQLDGLPKPILVHCDSGVRSSIIVLIKVAIEQGMRAEDALQKVAKLGLLND